jgi:hypothetical protein
MATCNPEIFGADPANIKWNVVRGDTSILRVEFYEDDEITPLDISDWEFESSAYDFKEDVTDSLEVVKNGGYVEIIISPEISTNWGIGYRATVAELAFDLQVLVDNETVWTPVVGTISVLADVTGGSL